MSEQQNPTPEEPKKRLKLREMPASVEAMKRFGQLIHERIMNLGIVTRSGKVGPTQCLMSEICVMEAKLDAFMQFMEDRHNVDFTEFNKYLEEAAAVGAATAVSMRAQMRP